MRRPLATIILFTVYLFASRFATASPTSAPFTYQGRLQQSGAPANGTFDMKFTLYDGPSGSVVGTPLIVSSVPVAGGLFTTTLDFGSGVLFSTTLWLGAAVRPSGGGPDWFPLSPYQQLTATPYALYSKAGNATSLTCAGCVNGGTIAADSIANGHVADGALSPNKISTAGAQIGQTLVFDGANVVWHSPGSAFLRTPAPALELERSSSAGSALESLETVRITGNIALDALGEAIVDLPAGFDTPGAAFRYQLTALGAPAPGLHVAETVRNGRFRISGGVKHGEASWQVTRVAHEGNADVR
jgi:hypothetical protein